MKNFFYKQRGEIATAAVLIGIGIMAVGAVIVSRLSNNQQAGNQDTRTMAQTLQQVPNCWFSAAQTKQFTVGVPTEIRSGFSMDPSQTPGNLSGQIFLDNFSQILAGQAFPADTGNIIFSWTPTAADVGNHKLNCRAWNDAIAECRPLYLVDAPPRAACNGNLGGGNPSLDITVQAPPPSINLVMPIKNTNATAMMLITATDKATNQTTNCTAPTGEAIASRGSINLNVTCENALQLNHTYDLQAWDISRTPRILIGRDTNYPISTTGVSNLTLVIDLVPVGGVNVILNITNPNATSRIQTIARNVATQTRYSCILNGPINNQTTITYPAIGCGGWLYRLQEYEFLIEDTSQGNAQVGISSKIMIPGDTQTPDVIIPVNLNLSAPTAPTCSGITPSDASVSPNLTNYNYQAQVTGGTAPITYQWSVTTNGGTVMQAPTSGNVLWTWNPNPPIAFPAGTTSVTVKADLTDAASKTATCSVVVPVAVVASTSTPVPQLTTCGHSCIDDTSCAVGAVCSASVCVAKAGYACAAGCDKVCTDATTCGTNVCANGQCVGLSCPNAPACASACTAAPVSTNTPVAAPPTPTPIAAGVWNYTLGCNATVVPATFTENYTTTGQYMNYPYYVSVLDNTNGSEQPTSGPLWNDGGGFGAGGSGQLGGFYQVGHTYRFMGIICKAGMPCGASGTTAAARKQQAIDNALVLQTIDNVSCASPVATPTPTPVPFTQPVSVTITNPSATGEYKIKISQREASQNTFTECTQVATATSPATGDCAGLVTGKKYIIQVVGIAATGGSTVTTPLEQQVDLTAPPAVAGPLPTLTFSVTLPAPGCAVIPAPTWPGNWLTSTAIANTTKNHVKLIWNHSTYIPVGAPNEYTYNVVVFDKTNNIEFTPTGGIDVQAWFEADVENSITYEVSVTAKLTANSCGAVSPALTGIIYPSAVAPTVTPGGVITSTPGGPTATPGPTNTPGPTSTPGPTNTPGPTATPTNTPCVANGGACLRDNVYPDALQDPNRSGKENECTGQQNHYFVDNPPITDGCNARRREFCCMPESAVVRIAAVPFCEGKQEGFYKDTAGACVFCAGRLVVPFPNGSPTWGSASVQAAKCEVTDWCRNKKQGWFFENKAAKSCYYCWGTIKGESYGYIDACPQQKIEIEQLTGSEETGNNIFIVIIKKAGTATSDIMKQIRKFLKLEGRTPGQLFFFFREPWKP